MRPVVEVFRPNNAISVQCVMLCDLQKRSLERRRVVDFSLCVVVVVGGGDGYVAGLLCNLRPKQ